MGRDEGEARPFLIRRRTDHRYLGEDPATGARDVWLALGWGVYFYDEPEPAYARAAHEADAEVVRGLVHYEAG